MVIVKVQKVLDSVTVFCQDVPQDLTLSLQMVKKGLFDPRLSHNFKQLLLWSCCNGWSVTIISCKTQKKTPQTLVRVCCCLWLHNLSGRKNDYFCVVKDLENLLVLGLFLVKSHCLALHGVEMKLWNHVVCMLDAGLKKVHITEWVFWSNFFLMFALHLPFAMVYLLFIYLFPYLFILSEGY